MNPNHLQPAKKAFSLLWLALALLMPGMQSCSNPSSPADTDNELIRNQINEYTEEINRLSQKVNELRQELNERGESPAATHLVPVTVTEVKPTVFTDYFRTSATVEAVNKAVISPETSGHIRRLYAGKGEPVAKGQVVARLSTDVVEGQIEEVKARLELAETVYNRQKRLWDQEIGSEIQYLEAKNQLQRITKNLETLQSQREMSVMRSPIDGFVDEHFIKEGELASPGTPVMEIINLDMLYINADVSESYLPYVSENSTVILRFPAYPDVEMIVPVHRVGHVINPENRSFRLQVRVPNENGRYKPNMMANMSVKATETEDVVVIPTMLIGYDTQGHYVFTAEEVEEGTAVARRRYIERGKSAEGKTLVKKGLAAGDLLIRQGHLQVASGEAIRIDSFE